MIVPCLTERQKLLIRGLNHLSRSKRFFRETEQYAQMRIVTIATLGLLGLIVLFLAANVVQDSRAAANPEGICEDQEGSVCVLEASCPAGYRPSLAHTCFAESWRCCLPA